MYLYLKFSLESNLFYVFFPLWETAFDVLYF